MNEGQTHFVGDDCPGGHRKTDLDKIRKFAEDFKHYLDIRVESHGRVEITESMAFVEAMISVPLDVHVNPCFAGMGVKTPCPTPEAKPSTSPRRPAKTTARKRKKR